MKGKFFISIGIIFTFSSCATIFTGTSDRISFNSNPSGAIVYKNGVEMCKTPCSYKVKRSLNDTDIEMKLEGYETRVFTLDKEFNVVSIVNLGNLLAWAIDALSGAIYVYDRKNYDVTLSKVKSTSYLDARRINIDDKKKQIEVYVMEK